jgi:hypothetical protein
MKNILMLALSFIVFLICMTAFVGMSNGAYISGQGDLGAFTGDITYTVEDDIGKLSISLENTSFEDGYLTALAFMMPEDVYLYDFYSSSPSFKKLTYPISAEPFGKEFGLGASTSNKWLGGGGSPSKGIGLGDTTDFIFSLTGKNIYGINIDSFIGDNTLVTRFRGFEGGGSDKVPGGTAQVPEPITLLLLSSGLLYFGRYRRRK